MLSKPNNKGDSVAPTPARIVYESTGEGETYYDAKSYQTDQDDIDTVSNKGDSHSSLSRSTESGAIQAPSQNSDASQVETNAVSLL